MKMIACSLVSLVKMGSIDMSTRSFIGFRDENGEFFGIYCHYDGYPSHVGKILVEHHNSFAAAEALTNGSHVRNFDHDGTVCRFGQGDGAAETYEELSDVFHSGYDYAYLYSDQDNCWKCFERDRLFNGVIYEVKIPGNEPWA